jgi:rare lipoprotein A
MLVARMVAGCLLLALSSAHPALAGQDSARHHQAGKFNGKASYYNLGMKTASGVAYDPAKLTAAHRTLKFGTRVRVTDPKTGKNVVVTITDRGPFIKGRVMDVSLAAARLLGMIDRGVMEIVAEIEVPREPARALVVVAPLQDFDVAYD